MYAKLLINVTHRTASAHFVDDGQPDTAGERAAAIAAADRAVEAAIGPVSIWTDDGVRIYSLPTTGGAE